MTTDLSSSVILVTGGIGLVGRALQSHVVSQNVKGRWIFVSSSDADLRSYDATQALFVKHSPTAVIHLAAILMAGSDMISRSAELLHDNLSIDMNVLKCSHNLGVRKLVSTLSSFAYPAVCELPINEHQLHSGCCHKLYESYATAKRNLEVLSRAYRQQYSCDFVTIIPTNIFGFVSEPREDGPVIEAFLGKACKAAREDVDFVCRGSGVPLRQFCFAPDLANVLVWALCSYSDPDPLNVTGEELSIYDVARAIATRFKIEQKLKFDTSFPDGPKRRTVSDDKLRKLFPGYSPTSFADALPLICSKLTVSD